MYEVSKLGLLGGTFNPLHFGHLRTAEEVGELLGLDRIVFVPSAIPPHKEVPPVSASHRLEMVRRAVAGRPGFLVSDVELRRNGPSYTVDTLCYFQEKAGPGTELYFLCGLDAFLEVGSWRDHRRLFELANFLVFTRPGSDPAKLSGTIRNDVSPEYSWDGECEAYTCPGRKRIYFRRVTRLDISSTDIRARLARGASVRYLLPETVREYIMENGLYRGKEKGNSE